MVFTLKTGDNGNTMATVRITLAAAGLLVCGLALANGTSAESAVSAVTVKSAEAHPPAENTLAAADPDSPQAMASAKPKAAKAKAAKPRAARASTISGRTAKTVLVPKITVAAKPTASGRMQVEEPNADAPMSPARESKAWQKSHCPRPDRRAKESLPRAEGKHGRHDRGHQGKAQGPARREAGRSRGAGAGTPQPYPGKGSGRLGIRIPCLRRHRHRPRCADRAGKCPCRGKERRGRQFRRRPGISTRGNEKSQGGGGGRSIGANASRTIRNSSAKGIDSASTRPHDGPFSRRGFFYVLPFRAPDRMPAPGRAGSTGPALAAAEPPFS